MKIPYKYITDFHKETTNTNFEYEVEDIIFCRESLIEKLKKNKLLKDDREKLILLLELLD